MKYLKKYNETKDWPSIGRDIEDILLDIDSPYIKTMPHKRYDLYEYFIYIKIKYNTDKRAEDQIYFKFEDISDVVFRIKDYLKINGINDYNSWYLPKSTFSKSPVSIKDEEKVLKLLANIDLAAFIMEFSYKHLIK